MVNPFTANLWFFWHNRLRCGSGLKAALQIALRCQYYWFNEKSAMPISSTCSETPGAPNDMNCVAGVDGARGGWLTIVWDAKGLSAELLHEAGGILAVPAATLAIDMPIGLTSEGGRTCDREARALLPRGRKASVFTPPRRYMLDRSYPEANAEGRHREGIGLSKQAWHISPRIAALDRALCPAGQGHIREAHPELIFHRLNGWYPLARKRSATGFAQRRDLLIQYGIPVHAALFDRFPRNKVKPDDILDALACAAAADAIRQGTAQRVPATSPVPLDRRGLRMEIWF